jgi:hypothetical protein
MGFKADGASKSSLVAQKFVIGEKPSSKSDAVARFTIMNDYR